MLRIRPFLAAFSVFTTTCAAAVPLSGVVASFELGDSALFDSREDGVVRVTGDSLAKGLTLALGGVSMANVAVWTGSADTLSRFAGNDPIPPSLRAIPIQRIDRNNDGIFDKDDEIRFWAHGPNFWKPDSNTELGWSHTIHPWARTRRYLIRLDAPNGSPDLGEAHPGSGPVPYSTVMQPVRVGTPKYRLERPDGEKVDEKDMGNGWFWINAKDSGNTLRLNGPLDSDLPGLRSDSALVKFRQASSSVLSSSWGQLTSVSLEGGAAWARRTSKDAPQSIWKGVFPSRSSRFALSFASSSSIGIQDYIFAYKRDLAGADSALFPAPSLGSVSIPVKNGSLTCWVLEDGVAVRNCSVVDGMLRDSVRVAGTWYALFPSNTTGIRPKLLKWTEPAGSNVVRDWDASRKADVLVFAPRTLLEIAQEYAVHREAAFQVRPMKVAILPLEEVYDLWSGGMTDPVAIRDATAWARKNWGASHLLLLGGGHGDPRELGGKGGANLLPRWQFGEEDSDDFFGGALTGAGTKTDSGLATGRVPARTQEEARAWLDKLKVFEDPSKAQFGPWRNRVALTADDMEQAKRYDNMAHTAGMEQIAKIISGAKPWMRQDKVYLVSYPLNGIGQKPEAARDLQAVLNQGVAAMNYLGHGGSTILADENLMNAADIERTLKNQKTPFLFFAGSCTVGRNDQPNSRSLAELLVTSGGKGAFAALAATRPTYDSPNDAFSQELWRKLLDNVTGRTIGEAMLVAKRLGGKENLNNVRYNLLGDPATVLFPGGITPTLDSIPDTLAALSKVGFVGKTGTARSVEARLEVLPILDTVLYSGVDENSNPKVDSQVFLQSPQQILATLARAENGAYSVSPGLPARVPFGSNAMGAVYVWDSLTRRDGGLVTGNKLFWGTASTGMQDAEGPSISIRPCDSSWSAGVEYGKEARIPVPFCITVGIQDSSGISYEQGPDEGVVLSMPGVVDPWHPELRQGADYREASAMLVLDSTMLEPGKTAPLEVTARDLMGNLSRRRLTLVGEKPAEVGLFEVFNSPNPVRQGESTTFNFKLFAEPDTNGSVDSRASASIRIHTMSGKLVKVLRSQLGSKAGSLPRAVWDLRDSFGKEVANGLYPYTVILRVPNSSGVGSVQREAKGVVAISR